MAVKNELRSVWKNEVLA